MLLFGLAMVVMMIWKPRGLISTREPIDLPQRAARDLRRTSSRRATADALARRDPLLAVEHLTMRFGGLVAVNDVSFSVGRGDITALIGPNGAGKTTRLQLHHRLLQADAGPHGAERRGKAAPTDEVRAAHPHRRAPCALPSGDIFLLERMPDFEIAAKARVARTFQNIRLFSGMTVLENLIVAQHNALMHASGWTILGLFGAPRYARAEEAAIERAQLLARRSSASTERADDPAGDLPYGDQRRLEIARAMCTRSRCCSASTSRRPASIRARAPSSTRCCASSATSTAPRSC